MNLGFKSVFTKAIGSEISPFPYQISVATQNWPDILKIETRMGKTAAIILAWLFKRLQDDPDTPRRLVYCLPMRVLVEQTASLARHWIENLNATKIVPEHLQPLVHVLMGGEIDKDWDMYPDQNAILIGTQDQLLSRALNRGYAMSRFRWPVQFGLLNNDCLWVMDEIQLMGSGLATTAQMHAFRKILGTCLPARSVWMSATLQRDWLGTMDFFPMLDTLSELTLSTEDKSNPAIKRRLEAKKILQRADCPPDKPEKIADMILEVHQKETRTLAVLNTVRRAADVFQALKERNPKAVLTLIHSRFRPQDRAAAIEQMLSPPSKEGSICISTQVIEAGVDVSAKTLITDLAPWASLVQRFGRCNRYGQDTNAQIFWLDMDLDKKGDALPYRTEELKNSRSTLIELNDAGPINLPPVSSVTEHEHVIRRKDIVELFDTTPDLAGLDIDISRFIRDSEDHDVHVFWRDLPKEGPEESEPAPSREELCPVPVNELKAVQGLERWRWDHLERRWERQGTVAPGMILMLRTSAGCYNPELGWTGARQDIPPHIASLHLAEEANDDDFYSSAGWQSLKDHNDAIVKEMHTLLSRCIFPEEIWRDTLLLAARWHDVGKGHEIYQQAMVGNPPEADSSMIWGKTALPGFKYARKGFRHELASGIAILPKGLPDLVAYLAAAHHGKVRLSIRSLPHESKPSNPDLRFARGIWDGDVLPEMALGEGHLFSKTMLDLSFMEIGEGPRGQSWLARMLALRDDESLGPFRLAYFEAILRSADWRASRRAGQENE